MGDLFSTEFTNFFFGGVLSRFESHPRANFLTIFLIGYTNHLYIADLWVSIEEILNFTRIDILTAAVASTSL